MAGREITFAEEEKLAILLQNAKRGKRQPTG